MAMEALLTVNVWVFGTTCALGLSVAVYSVWAGNQVYRSDAPTSDSADLDLTLEVAGLESRSKNRLTLLPYVLSRKTSTGRKVLKCKIRDLTEEQKRLICSQVTEEGSQTSDEKPATHASEQQTSLPEEASEE
jgi:hypothetical protein